MLWRPLGAAIHTLDDALRDCPLRTSPGNLHGWDAGAGAREINLFWTQSVDNQTPQASIVYKVYQNGVLDHTITGAGRTILYANQAGENTFTVIAVDEAGNKSAPAGHIIVSQ
jgi:hypothetical protein